VSDEWRDNISGPSASFFLLECGRDALNSSSLLVTMRWWNRMVKPGFLMASLSHCINPRLPTSRFFVMGDNSDITVLVRLVVNDFGCK